MKDLTVRDKGTIGGYGGETEEIVGYGGHPEEIIGYGGHPQELIGAELDPRRDIAFIGKCITPRGTLIDGESFVGSESFVGGWWDKVTGFTGKAVGKTLGFAGRIVGGGVKTLGYAGKNIIYSPVKNTFFRGKPKPKRPTPPPAPPAWAGRPYPYQQFQRPIRPRYPQRAPRLVTPIDDVQTLRQAQTVAPQQISAIKRIARNVLTARKERARRLKEAKDKIKYNKLLKQYRQIEAKDEERLALLEAQAAEAEAEAELAESELQLPLRLAEGPGMISGIGAYNWRDTVGPYLPAHVVGHGGRGSMGFWDKLFSKRWTKPVMKHAGPLAKAALMKTPYGKALRKLANVYNEAQADPKAPAKLKRVKALADQPGATRKQSNARKVMAAMSLGKAVSDQVTAADLVDAKLKAKKAQALKGKLSELRGAMGRGADGTVMPMLPSNARVIAVVPFAKQIYLAAKKGKKGARDGIRQAAELLRLSALGNQKAKQALAAYRVAAKKGDKGAQMAMGAVAVAAAAAREKVAAKRATPSRVSPDAVVLPTRRAAGESPLRRLDDAHAEGLNLKLQMAQAQ